MMDREYDKQTLMLNFTSPCGKFLLTFEDDGKVAYAYLKDGGDIVGDVWLYNRCTTPDRAEWSEVKNIPFANCTGYMSDEGRLQQLVHDGDVIVDWEFDNERPFAYVYIHGALYGALGVGDKPGYARFAIRDNRLARVMEIED